MGVYVITGGTAGIGAEVRRLLLEERHEVFNVDYKGYTKTDITLFSNSYLIFRYTFSYNGAIKNASICGRF